MTAHDADKVLGRIRKDGGWDRRFRRPAHSLSSEVRQARPASVRPPSLMGVELGTWDDVAQVVAGVLVLGGSFAGIMFSIGGAWTPMMYSLVAVGLGVMVEGARIMGRARR